MTGSSCKYSFSSCGQHQRHFSEFVKPYSLQFIFGKKKKKKDTTELLHFQPLHSEYILADLLVSRVVISAVGKKKK